MTRTTQVMKRDSAGGPSTVEPVQFKRCYGKYLLPEIAAKCTCYSRRSLERL